MKNLIITILFFFAVAITCTAQEQPKQAEQKFELVKHYFVLLMKGPNRTQPDSVAQKLQEGHMANINKMYNEGKLICAGPFADDKGGGIFILTVKTEDEAKKLIENDPAVKAGRLTYEIRPWMTAKGTFTAEK